METRTCFFVDNIFFMPPLKLIAHTDKEYIYVIVIVKVQRAVTKANDF